MAQVAQSELGNANASREAIAGALARILASPTFGRSPRLREFLAFVCERVMQNREAEINETEIATHVFGRPPDSRLSSEDTIVRSSARHLRAKLKEYYEKEGAAETLLVEIPTGSYVPMIRNRFPVAQPAASPVEAVVE